MCQFDGKQDELEKEQSEHPEQIGLFWDKIVSVCLESTSLIDIVCGCEHSLKLPKYINKNAEVCSASRTKTITVCVCRFLDP